jgi:hypothetical protein
MCGKCAEVCVEQSAVYGNTGLYTVTLNILMKLACSGVAGFNDVLNRAKG